ncbi:MAG: hypothetical protein LAT50_12175 [Ectothiorhodospiraceae bacterium]|nr:hypothetical protein [Ectothiorhodospiraceae bacterium]
MKVSRFPDVDAARRHYLGAIDEAAGALRAKYITDVPGQPSTYERKERDARSVLADEPGPHPWGEAEAEALDVSMTEAAQLILAQAEAWEQLGCMVERERMRHKRLVREAETARDADAVYQAALAAFDQIDQIAQAGPLTD